MNGSLQSGKPATESARLFVAIDVNDAVRTQLAAARESIESGFRTMRQPPRVTWVRPEVAHVTLRFLGQIARDRVRLIQDALGSVAFAPFDMAWESVGTFGRVRHPRVIWVAPTHGVEAVRVVATQVNQYLDPLLGPGDPRAFSPHLTLGRIRESRHGVDWAQVLAGVRFGPTISRVDHVTLYQSRLSPKGPTYTALSTYG